MNAIPTVFPTSRRGFLKAATAGAVGVSMTHPVLAQRPATGETVRDRLWIFTCAANSDFPHIGRRSVVTPAEGAFYLGVPNIFMVQSSESEAPYGRLHSPLAQYNVALEPLKRVVWSVVGSGGFYSPEETAEVLEMARTTSNFVGVMLDDFFTGRTEGRRAKLTVEELTGIRRQLKRNREDLAIFATFYTNRLDLPVADYLDLIDVLTLWTGDPEQLVNLESNMEKVEAVAPKSRKMLGCYVVHYAKRQGTPLAAMKHQCETGLRWLKEGRIEGIIFLGNTTLDLGFESVKWTRQWIQDVGDTRL